MREAPPVGFRFSMLHRASKKYVDEQMKAEGLTGVQLFVLGQLRKLEESGLPEINQKDLEKASCVTHPTMTEILKRLERKGYVLCTRSETDRRYKCVTPTDKVQGVGRRLREADETVFAELCRGLSEEQIGQFLSVTEIMAANAERILWKGCDGDGNDQNPCREPQRI